jgi:hypothetical protein
MVYTYTRFMTPNNVLLYIPVISQRQLRNNTPIFETFYGIYYVLAQAFSFSYYNYIAEPGF